jgi:hypothetical protein
VFDMIVLMVIGGVVLALAVLFIGLGKYQSSKSQDIQAAQTYSTSALQQMLSTLPPEGKALEVKGVIECDNPLVSPMTKKLCVAYNFKVERRYEDRDLNGDTRSNSETVHQDNRRANFWVRDETGRVLVLADGANFDLNQTATQFETNPNPSFGLQIDLTRGLVDFQVGSNYNNGFQYTEHALYIGQPVYVLGSLQSYQGQPALANRENKRFLISWRSEEALLQSSMKWKTAFYALGSLLAVVGAGLLGYGVVR